MMKLALACVALLLVVPACGGEKEPAKPATPTNVPKTPPAETPAAGTPAPEETPAADPMAKAKEMVARLTKLVQDGDMEGAKKLLGELQAMDLTAELQKQVDDAAKMIKAKDAAGGLLGK